MSSERGNREWLNDYLSLKQVNSSNPFTVPEGYFEESEQQIVSFINLDAVMADSPEQGLTVPENYFEDLSGNITARINIEEAIGKQTAGHTVPEGYFEGLSEQIQSRIMVEEILSESTEIFAVPQDYFGRLTENILNKTAGAQQAVKQKGVIRQLFSSATFTYATAACLTLAVGATILLSQGGNSNVAQNHNNSFLHKSLSAIPVEDIKSYLQQNVDPTDTRTLIDDNKQVNADNLTDDLQDELDTSQ